MIILLTYIISLWVINAWHDSDYYNKKDAHISGAFLAAFAIAGLFLLVIIGLTRIDFNDIINLSFLALMLRWIVFDISYNLFIGQRWYYVGQTALMDRVIPNWLQFSMKLACVFFDVLIVKSYINLL